MALPKLKHVLSADQFSPEMLYALFEIAHKFAKEVEKDGPVRRALQELHKHRSMVSFFGAASTRTRLTFQMAAFRLGITTVFESDNAEQFSSLVKGEPDDHAFRVIAETYPDIIVMRHTRAHTVKRAAELIDELGLPCHMINAGDGNNEHPTQALLDLFTILQRHGRLDRLHVVIGGDLKYGRTAKSLAIMLSKFEGNKVSFVAPPELQISEEFRQQLVAAGLEVELLTGDYDDALRKADVVYWTRLQIERMKTSSMNPMEQYRFWKLRRRMTHLQKTFYQITPQKMRLMKDTAIIMHPMPIDGRIREIHQDVERDPRCWFFRQAKNGVPVRMAVMHVLLSGWEDVA